MSGVFNTSYQEKWVYIFKDYRFKVYKGTIKIYQIYKIYNIIDRPNRQILQFREVFNSIKNKFYKFKKLTLTLDLEVRKKQN